MGARMMRNIKVKGDNLRFEHNSARAGCSYSSSSVEVIRYYNHAVYFHSISGEDSQSVQMFSATEQDFEMLKKFLSTSQKFIHYGQKIIFSLDNLKGVVDNGDMLSVNCTSRSYNIRVKSAEDAQDFIETVKSKLDEEDSVNAN